MNKEETKAWVNTLKPGDKVIYYGAWNCAPAAILFVKKVTPTGIVRTENGSYKVGNYGNRCAAQGSGYGYIGPYTEADASAAKKHVAEVEEQRRQERLIRAAKIACHDLCCGKIQMTAEMAEAILTLVKGERENNHG